MHMYLHCAVYALPICQVVDHHHNVVCFPVVFGFAVCHSYYGDHNHNHLLRLGCGYDAYARAWKNNKRASGTNWSSNV